MALIAPMESSLDRRLLADVLAEIAETAAETLELQDVFDRVATSIRRLIPLDNMGVVRILDDRLAVLHASTVPCEDPGECSEPSPLEAWSPRVRPRPGPIQRLDDASTELDPAFPADASILESGVRSCLWEPFRTGNAFLGGVWMASSTPFAFTEEHQEALAPIAALLGSAVQHWRIWDADRRRSERLDRLEPVFSLLADSLDIREVIGQVSAQVRSVLPHDVLILTQHEESGGGFRVIAHAGESDVPVPEGTIELTEEERKARLRDHVILRDTREEVMPDTERNRLLLDSGMRSWLRVPVRLWGEVGGSLGFFDREPGRYSTSDVEVARRLADRIALVVCHGRLADEAQAAAAERERAARLEATVETLSRELEARERIRVVGASRSWRQVLQQVGKVASSETTVLITGESGTGKEVVARLIHQGSPRAKRPFVAVNCAALPEQLLESELFGHEKGAFTGALTSKMGRLEQAAGGTLFLDEIAEMNPLMQAKLLRVLQEREFQRLGGTRPLKADVRVLAATNRDLLRAIAGGGFREDLYYRLNVFEVHTPPLRERPDDILPLAESFLTELAPSMPRPAAGISRDAREWLLAYPWPGNVRELRNAMERAILLCDGGLITREHLPAIVGQPERARAVAGNGGDGGSLGRDTPLPPGGVDLDDVERGYVEKALAQTRGNKAKASRLLGLTRAQLYTRLEKYGLR